MQQRLRLRDRYATARLTSLLYIKPQQLHPAGQTGDDACSVHPIRQLQANGLSLSFHPREAFVQSGSGARWMHETGERVSQQGRRGGGGRSVRRPSGSSAKHYETTIYPGSVISVRTDFVRW
ncbi:MAG: hypothetical protein MSD82_13340, partial [Prevotella sp.]|nr:hypothetical protein [Prevotella sp.]